MSAVSPVPGWSHSLAGDDGHDHDHDHKRPARARARLRQRVADGIDRSGQPNVAAMIENLATLDLGGGKVGEAIAKYRRSLAIRRRLLHAEHPQIAISLINLASAELEVGDRRGAQTLAEEALTKLRAAYGDDAPYVAFARSVLADALPAPRSPSPCRSSATTRPAIAPSSACR